MPLELSRRRFLQTSLLGAAASRLSVAQAEEGKPSTAAAAPGPLVEIGTERQLFHDDFLIDLALSQNVTRKLNPPVSIRKVLKPDQPWESLGFIFYCSVVDDEGTAKLYYGSYDADKKKHFCLATSRDGLAWERADLGLKQYQGNGHNNLLPFDAVEASVFLDPHAPAEQRYRLIFTQHWPDPVRAGIYVSSSPDGLHWTTTPDRVLPCIPDSQHSAVWDERLKQYAIYLRAWNPIRTVARVGVKDLLAPWPYDSSVPPFQVWGKDKIPTLSRELPTVMATDAEEAPGLELYTSVVNKYAWAANAYLAFPAAFQLYKGPQWESRAVNTADGSFDIDIATSRDGITWNRWRQPYLPAGAQDGANLKLVSMGPGFIRRGRWLHQYFVGWTYTHGLPVVWDRDPASRAAYLGKDLSGIYCATQRVDGFISMDAGASEGHLTTQPFVFQGNRLYLNLHTAGSGSARVALLDQGGRPIAGFTADDCEFINADEIDCPVRWKDGADIGVLAGHPVRLQFTLRYAKLFAFQFAEDRAA